MSKFQTVFFNNKSRQIKSIITALVICSLVCFFVAAVHYKSTQEKQVVKFEPGEQTKANKHDSLRKTLSTLREAKSFSDRPIITVLEEMCAASIEKKQSDQLLKIIEACKHFTKLYPDTSDSVLALKLIYQCYEQIGDIQAADTAFLAYAKSNEGYFEMKALQEGKDKEIVKEQGERAYIQVIRQRLVSLEKNEGYMHIKRIVNCSNMLIKYCDEIISVPLKVE